MSHLQCAVFDEIQKDVDRTAEGKKSFAATNAGRAVLTRILKASPAWREPAVVPLPPYVLDSVIAILDSVLSM